MDEQTGGARVASEGSSRRLELPEAVCNPPAKQPCYASERVIERRDHTGTGRIAVVERVVGHGHQVTLEAGLSEC